MAGPDHVLPSPTRFGARGFYLLARDLFIRNLNYLDPSLTIIGLFGAILFPAYYLVWVYVFPQSYENLPLRLIASLLCLIIAARQYLPRWLRRFDPLLWFLTCLYVLPFFFTYMLLKNESSQVWLMSTMVAAFILVLLVDWLNLIVIFVAGTALAWVCYAVTEQIVVPPSFDLEIVPVLLFVVIFGSILNYKVDLIKRERLNAMLTVAGNIAHEMRTPLLSIKAGAIGLQRQIPALLESYRAAQAQGLAVPKIRDGQLAGLAKVLDRISSETDHANVIIDMLLANAGKTEIGLAQFNDCSIVVCIDRALDRFVFKSAAERAKLNWDRRNDFTVRGSEILIIHVMFNLLKNSLYFIGQAGKGDITIRLEPRKDANYLYFRDTGTGIAADKLPNIFQPFYTSLEQGTGTGMGLSFCKMVMDGFGGAIACRSEIGEFTEFELKFPRT